MSPLARGWPDPSPVLRRARSRRSRSRRSRPSSSSPPVVGSSVRPSPSKTSTHPVDAATGNAACSSGTKTTSDPLEPAGQCAASLSSSSSSRGLERKWNVPSERSNPPRRPGDGECSPQDADEPRQQLQHTGAASTSPENAHTFDRPRLALQLRTAQGRIRKVRLRAREGTGGEWQEGGREVDEPG